MKTALRDVFNAGRGNRPYVRDVIILVTDGQIIDTPSLGTTLRRVKNRGIRIIGVVVGDDVNHELMRRVVSAPHQTHYFNVDDYILISNLLRFLVRQTCITAGPPPTQRFIRTTSILVTPSSESAPGKFVNDINMLA